MEKLLKTLIVLTVINLSSSQTLDYNVFCSAKAAGNFEVPGALNCTQYIKCYASGGSMLGQIYTCVGTTLFNPSTQLCVTGFTCVPQTTTTTLAPTSTLAPPTTTTLQATTKGTFNISEFCASLPMGYFQHPSIATCIPYIYCYPNNNIMIGIVYNCMGSTRFHPNLAYCVDGYVCGSIIPTVPTTSTTTKAPTTTTTTTTTPKPTTTTTTTTPSTTTTTTTPSTTTTTTTPSTTTTELITTTTESPLDPNAMCATLKRGYYMVPLNSTATALVYCYKMHKVKHGIIVTIFINTNPETTKTIEPVTATSTSTTTTTPTPTTTTTTTTPTTTTTTTTPTTTTTTTTPTTTTTTTTPTTTTTTTTPTTTTTTPTTTTTTTTTTPTTTTTTEAPFDPVAFCQGKAVDYYDYVVNDTCTSQVYCYKLNKEKTGVVVIDCYLPGLMAAMIDPDLICQDLPLGYNSYVVDDSCILQIDCYKTNKTKFGAIVSNCNEAAMAISPTPFDATGWCASKDLGFYPYPVLDVTCIPYVNCYLSSSLMVGEVLNCTGTTLFNPDLGVCQDGFLCEI